uniref:Uncharacterized protein n=1 Tax=Aegilops tauschii subsp. strangulata TaxID=200361 RepID=A0A453R9B6_AEGTS
NLATTPPTPPHRRIASHRMAAAAVASNGGAAPVPGRLASVYSEVQTSRIAHALPLPSVLRSHFTLADGPASTAAGSPGE